MITLMIEKEMPKFYNEAAVSHGCVVRTREKIDLPEAASGHVCE